MLDEKIDGSASAKSAPSVQVGYINARIVSTVFLLCANLAIKMNIICIEQRCRGRCCISSIRCIALPSADGTILRTLRVFMSSDMIHPTQAMLSTVRSDGLYFLKHAAEIPPTQRHMASQIK